MKINHLYTLFAALAVVAFISITVDLLARGGGGHAGHRGGYGHRGYGNRGYGRGGWGYGGYGFGAGLGLGFALGYPGYWNGGYYYNSQPIIIDNTNVDPGEAYWDEDENQWVID